jgi:hypothetical protein
MQKFLLVFDSENHKTGAMLVTTSPRATCPASCPFRRGGSDVRCYADRGYLGQYIWGGLDRTPPGKTFGNQIPVYTFAQLLIAVRCLEPGSVWRHNQAGDLAAAADGTIDHGALEQLVAANQGRRGFTFTHHDALDNVENRAAIQQANLHGFRINLSANDLAHADALTDLGVAPVAVIVPATQRTNLTTPKGRTVVICPAITHSNITCASCKLCTRQRKVIIGFPQLGGKE